MLVDEHINTLQLISRYKTNYNYLVNLWTLLYLCFCVFSLAKDKHTFFGILIRPDQPPAWENIAQITWAHFHVHVLLFNSNEEIHFSVFLFRLSLFNPGNVLNVWVNNEMLHIIQCYTINMQISVWHSLINQINKTHFKRSSHSIPI